MRIKIALLAAMMVACAMPASATPVTCQDWLKRQTLIANTEARIAELDASMEALGSPPQSAALRSKSAKSAAAMARSAEIACSAELDGRPNEALFAASCHSAFLVATPALATPCRPGAGIGTFCLAKPSQAADSDDDLGR
jgi:hypothetical protein